MKVVLLSVSKRKKSFSGTIEPPVHFYTSLCLVDEEVSENLSTRFSKCKHQFSFHFALPPPLTILLRGHERHLDLILVELNFFFIYET
jgi:hypothetical protein